MPSTHRITYPRRGLGPNADYPTSLRALNAPGDFFLFFAATLRTLFAKPLKWRDAIEQGWVMASVCTLPAALIAIPFGAVIALQLGSISSQLGAQSLTGSSSVVAILREGAPLGAALMLAGAAGAAICADMGARTVREEIDAMKVMGVDPIYRLVAPRVVAAVVVGAALTGFVMGVGIAGGYFFNVFLQNGTPGVYADAFRNIATLPDLYVGIVKGMIFGGLAAVIASFKGLRAGGGPKGVGQAVNEAVVLSFVTLFAVNFLVTSAYLSLAG